MSANRWKGAAAAVAQVNTVTVGHARPTPQVYSVTMGVNNAKVVSYTATGADTNLTIAAALQGAAGRVHDPGVRRGDVDRGLGGRHRHGGDGGDAVHEHLVGNGDRNARNRHDDGQHRAEQLGQRRQLVARRRARHGGQRLSRFEFGLRPVRIGPVGRHFEQPERRRLVHGAIGLPETNANGYLEYRQRYLQIGATTVNVGQSSSQNMAQGSPLINIDAGTVQTALNVYTTGTSATQGLEALQWKGNNAANVVTVQKGSVALAGYGGDSATVATLNVGYVTSPTGDAQVRTGAGLRRRR